MPELITRGDAAVPIEAYAGLSANEAFAERLRFRRAVVLDAMEPEPAFIPSIPEGGFVQALARELNTTVDELLAWWAAQDD